MFVIFKNRKIIKDFILNVREHKYGSKEAIAKLKEFPIEVVQNIGKEIIYADYDGYNGNSKSCELVYFNNLERWQKEFFIEQRLYKLYT